MNWKVITGLIFAFILLTFVNGWVEGTYFPATDTVTLNELLSFSITQYSNIASGILGFAGYAWDWLRFLVKALMFDYAFYEGNMVIFRILLMCIPAGIIYGVVTQWVRGTS